MSKISKIQGLLTSLKTSRKRILVGVLCLCLVVFLGQRYLGKKQNSAAVLAARVQVAKAQSRANFTSGLDTTTSLKANADVILKSKVDTYVKQFYVEKGQSFPAGALLVELEHGNQSAQVESASAQIDVNRAAAASAQSTLKNAASDQERYDILIAKGYTTRQEVEAKRTNASTAGADYNKAVSNIAYAEAQLKAAEASLRDYYFTAPFDGVVLDDYSMSVGSKVAPETSILRIADISVIKASISIPEQQLQNIKEGMLATITCDSLPGQKFTGTIKKLNAFVDTQTHTVQADVYIDNTAYHNVLKPGMFARVFVEENATATALVIPSEALNKENKILVVREHKVITVPVAPGLTYKNETAVTGALQAGDLVITSGGNSLKDGDEVTYDEESA